MAAALHDESAAHWFVLSASLGSGPLLPTSWDLDASPLRQDGRLGFSHSWAWLVLPAVTLFTLFTLGGWELHALSKAKARSRSSAVAKALLWAKISLCGTLALTQGVALALQLMQNNNSTDDDDDDAKEQLVIGSRLLSLLALFLAAPLHWQSFHKLRHASTPLLFFWLGSVVAHAAQLNNLILDSRSRSVVTPLAAVDIAVLAQLVAVFTAELWGPEDFEPAIHLGTEEWEEADLDYSGRSAPEEKANIFSVLFFSWMTPMMKLGYRKHLMETDLWALPKPDQADAIGQKLAQKWQRQRQLVRDGRKSQPSLWIALAQAYGGPYWVAAGFKAAQDVLSFLQPQLLKALLRFVDSYRTDHPQPASRGFAIALMMFMAACCQTFALHQYFARCFSTNMRVRSGLIHAIYRKSLIISSDERSGRASGDVVNLQSTDATRIGELLVYGQTIWSGCFQIVLAFVSLYSLMGIYGLLGAVVMIAAVPLNSYVARVQARMQAKQMKNKDQRSRLMNEILNNIRTIKLACWEEAFAAKLNAVRNEKELPMLAKIGYLNSATSFLWSFVADDELYSPFFVGFATFACVALGSDIVLTSAIVFPALSLLNLLTFPLAMLPNVITSWIEAFVSARRLVDFLDAGELQPDAVQVVPVTGPLKYGDELVKIDQGTVTWSSMSARPILSGIDLTARKGELLAVVGRVGAGKSSTLSAILGEMVKLSGTFTVKGSVAYVPQNPWIMGGTVRDNITFGAKFDQEFYDIVIEACALKSDLSILPKGDMSEVGEKGLALSGGQKARLSLARAVYCRADIYLLDDPLSAVDSHVGRHLFDRVIGGGGLLAGKARILCTNAISFIQHADEIIMLRDGRIVERGTWASTKDVAGSSIYALIEEFGKKEEEEEPSSDSDDTAVEGKDQSSTDNLKMLEDLKRRASTTLTRRASYLNVQEHKAETFRVLKASSRPTESRETGSVKFDTYKKFVRANGIFPFCLYLLTTCLSQGFNVLASVWLKTWAQHNTVSKANDYLGYYLGVYFGLGLGTAFMGFLTGVILYTFCVVRSARLLHDGMFQSVMRSPMLFFETTPIGVILNRFSRDIYVIDEMLARFIRDLVRMIAVVASVLIVVETSVPLYILVVIPVFFVYRTVQKYYLATSRELKRLDATTKSPIFASFSETLNGISTIRGFRQQERFVAINEGRLDRNQECYYPSVSCNRWLAVRLELMGAFLIFAAAMLSVVSLVTGGPMDAGLVGIIITFSLQITGSLNWLVRAGTEVETNIVSVERVIQYSELKPEAPMHVEGINLPENWPDKGEIKFDHFAARYRPELDLVLRDVDVQVAPAEKVGIVGRTGAGKSSLSSALFRIIEPASGTIYIDGVDISKIGLADLRSRLSIIPQDAQCFEGTLRENLDPPARATDHELWQALEHSGLKAHAESMGGLEARVDEGGSNLSAGQRQLMCFARALIRKSRILVLDEATAQVDVESDKAVQKIIRSEFKDRTILTVAHRLNTIADSDRILALDQGRVKEFDSPSALLATPGSIYLGLATEAGLVGGSSRKASAAPSRDQSSVNLKQKGSKK